LEVWLVLSLFLVVSLIIVFQLLVLMFLDMPEKNNIEFKEECLFEFFSEINDWDKILRCSAPLVLFLNAFLQIFRSSAAFHWGLKVQSIKIFRQESV
jgi:hypothetical protein